MALRDIEHLAFTRGEVERSITDRFTRVVAVRGSALAIAAGNERVTYTELARLTDQLAVAIVHRASSRDAPVAVFSGDPVAMIAGILATWKAGKLCVPLDGALPPARLGEILRDSNAQLILTDRDGSAALAPLADTTRRELRVDELDRAEDVDPPQVTVIANAPALLLYTSGSTGEPKGIVRTHRTILHRARCSVASLAVGPADRVSALHSPAFAGGLRDVTTALLGGAALLPFDLRQAGQVSLALWIVREQISVLCAVVTTLRHLIASVGPGVHFPSVRIVRLGSEALYRQDVDRLRQHLRADCVLVAGYGASEASGIVEYRMEPGTPLPAGRIPAGYPLEGVEIILLDEDGRALGHGEVGEVAVRSRYLSSGYWLRPALTDAVFSRDSADVNLRTYRTGDIGRLRSDGCLELLGRRDHQVKVRGYRVDPGEIELALVEHPAVRAAIVTGFTDPDGNTRLAAYVVPHAAPAPSAGVLRQFLQSRLPVYMVPVVFVALDEFPLTPNGKVDRQALPPATRPVRKTPYVAPRSPMEHQIAAIWEELFDMSPIGATDDYFDLGGDSLLAAAFVAAIEETCGRTVSPRVLLEASSVSGLAAAIARVENGFNEPLTALRATGSRAPLFFLHNDYGRGLYTHAVARCIDPERPFYAVHIYGLDALALQATVEAIAADRLRAVRTERPHGPYALGGHCHGGLIALEMARQLRADGEDVEVVAMIDTRAPAFGARVLRRTANTLGLEDALETTDWWAHYYWDRLGILWGSGGRAQMDFLRRKLGGTTEPEGAANRESELEVAQLRRFCRRAVRRHVPAPYAGPVALFRAEHYPASRPDLGWSKLLPRLEVAVIPGDHLTCITRHVAAFGARLDAVLRRPASYRRPQTATR